MKNTRAARAFLCCNPRKNNVKSPNDNVSMQNKPFIVIIYFKTVCTQPNQIIAKLALPVWTQNAYKLK